ncbi:hypothetical protein CIPAW_13G160100 [Carya illinoinensis]|uniref:Uncharacterized protein n=1 Tax=Carya illinoinensis TaxID=32201 RepID=A0A8T1NPY3_CARIL|nr:hypothetical protein CIPAW_13G160100 [Carya illinoinensis]
MHWNYSSLERLRLENSCDSLESFPLNLLSNLKFINSCPKLKFVQEEGLPASISSLWISNCALLEKQLQSRKGKAWHKIAHIPCINIKGF